MPSRTATTNERFSSIGGITFSAARLDLRPIRPVVDYVDSRSCFTTDFSGDFARAYTSRKWSAFRNMKQPADYLKAIGLRV